MFNADVRPTTILMSELQGDRSYLLVFAATDGSAYEIRLTGAGWPGEFTGFMSPYIRNQMTDESAELPWERAEELAAQLSGLLHTSSIAKGGLTRAQEFVEALVRGKRYGA